MATVIRPERSRKNKYWLDKHRYYELKHFCLQYPIWKKVITDGYSMNISTGMFERVADDNLPCDPTGNIAIRNLYYRDQIDLIERIARESDESLSIYILKAVTEGLSYPHLKSRLEIPCSRETYYDRYRRFFWLLSRERK